jgi:hypothetical protein
MSRSPKTIPQKGSLFNAQYDMCDLVYRKLNELMLSVGVYTIDIEFCDIQIRLLTEVGNGQDNTIYFYSISKSGGRTTLGYVNLKKLSSAEREDPMVTFCLNQKDSNDKAEIYIKWFEKVKEIMQKLFEQEKKYEDLIDSIKSLPLFSPTRAVIVEKTK